MNDDTAQQSRPSVADFLRTQIEASGKTPFEIASDCGWDNENVISMLKESKMKLPTAKVSLLARSLGIDPYDLLEVTMQEYQPDGWDVIQQILMARYERVSRTFCTCG
ncbi:MAG: hypothetical protein ACOZE7_03970 [Pseudomonadota bacterium]